MFKQLNDTINYIEEHLLDEKVIDEAMKRVSVSNHGEDGEKEDAR